MQTGFQSLAEIVGSKGFGGMTSGKRISAQGVRWWCTEIKAVPARNGWAIAVSKITGLSLHELNPAVYPKM